MYFYSVWVADGSYKRTEPLTYASHGRLQPGTLVRAPLKRSLASAVVVGPAHKPAFATKPLQLQPQLALLPRPLLELAAWMMQFYAASAGEVWQQLLPASFPPSIEPAARVSAPQISHLPPLTNEQQAASEAIEPTGTHLVHGDTGTGKTRLYIELALRAHAAGRSSLILTPEIGLTPQLAEQFTAVFGADGVTIVHSQLSAKTRLNQWGRLLQSGRQPQIVIGARSALFSPLGNLGLIVLDEAHETSYKQEQSPRYHAAAVAAVLARHHRAPLLSGSGTPALTDYYMAAVKQRPILRLRSPARQHSFAAPRLEVVDLKDRGQFSKRRHLSDALLQALSEALARGEQSLLFLNRRGTARTVLCDACGWQAVCDRCGLPLTYHGDQHQLRCHTCGLSAPARTSCPACGHTDIVLRSIGTKAIVSELQAAFPHARISRFDTDSSKAERLESQYQAVRDGQVDILVGTQLLAKGLDLPLLSVVGIVIADTGLYFPDFTAQERTYQLLRQVIGRVGRGHRTGQIVVQTYDPTNATIQAALHNNWEEYCERELAERRAFTFPPYCFLLKLSCRRASSQSAQSAAAKLAETFRSSGIRALIEGPAPAFHEKIGGKFQWQLVLKATDRRELLRAIALTPANWTHDIDPVHLL